MIWLALNCGADVPSSARSRAVAERVTPGLREAFAEQGLTWGAPVFMRIFKESNELEVWVQQGEEFVLFRTYAIHYYSGDLGPKLKEGDRQAPEGFYYVPVSAMNPNSNYHLSFNLGYPNAYDRANGRTGSLLMVHGSTVSIGCFAMTDARIEEIYTIVDAALRAGQPYFRVHVFPFRMTPENLQRHGQSEWISFWYNLKSGYDRFEEKRTPPNVEVVDRRYVFEAAE